MEIQLQNANFLFAIYKALGFPHLIYFAAIDCGFLRHHIILEIVTVVAHCDMVELGYGGSVLLRPIESEYKIRTAAVLIPNS